MIEGYYTRRTPPKTPDYEAAYWGVVVDPDGKVRDRLQERAQHLADIAQELSFIGSLPAGRILDVGCGLGYLLSGLDGAWERHGVEVSQFAAEHAGQWGKIFVGDLSAARFPDEHFDVVVLHHVNEHLPDPMATLQEVRRVLRPTGYLVLGTPDFDSGCARRFGPKYRLLHDSTHISLFTDESMHRCLRDHGFVIERVEYPFFDTRYFTPENLLRLFDTSQISPPFYGNFMTFYARKPRAGRVPAALAEAGRAVLRAAEGLAEPAAAAAERVAERLAQGGHLYLAAAVETSAVAAAVRDALAEHQGLENISLVAAGETPTRPISPGAVVLTDLASAAQWLEAAARPAGALAVYWGPAGTASPDDFDVVLSWPDLAPAWEAALRAALWDGFGRDIANALARLQVHPPG